MNPRVDTLDHHTVMSLPDIVDSNAAVMRQQFATQIQVGGLTQDGHPRNY